MTSFPLTPAQFAQLKQQLAAAPPVNLIQTSATQGTLTAENVTIAYAYDGATSLSFRVTAMHGIEDLASDSTIEAGAAKMLQKYVAQQGTPS